MMYKNNVANKLGWPTCCSYTGFPVPPRRCSIPPDTYWRICRARNKTGRSSGIRRATYYHPTLTGITTTASIILYATAQLSSAYHRQSSSMESGKSIWRRDRGERRRGREDLGLGRWRGERAGECQAVLGGFRGMFLGRHEVYMLI